MEPQELPPQRDGHAPQDATQVILQLHLAEYDALMTRNSYLIQVQYAFLASRSRYPSRFGAGVVIGQSPRKGTNVGHAYHSNRDSNRLERGPVRHVQ